MDLKWLTKAVKPKPNLTWAQIYKPIATKEPPLNPKWTEYRPGLNGSNPILSGGV